MNTFLELISDPTVQWAAIWSGVVLLTLLLFLRKPRTLTLATSDKGRLEISRHALNRLFEACCEQLNGVASARAQVTRHRGKFKTTLRLKVRPEAKLDAIQGYLIEEITSIYHDNLGLQDQVGPIHIEIVDAVPAADAFTER